MGDPAILSLSPRLLLSPAVSTFLLCPGQPCLDLNQASDTMSQKGLPEGKESPGPKGIRGEHCCSRFCVWSLFLAGEVYPSCTSPQPPSCSCCWHWNLASSALQQGPVSFQEHPLHLHTKRGLQRYPAHGLSSCRVLSLSSVDSHSSMKTAILL